MNLWMVCTIDRGAEEDVVERVVERGASVARAEERFEEFVEGPRMTAVREGPSVQVREGP